MASTEVLTTGGLPSALYGKVILADCLLPPEKIINTPSMSDGLTLDQETDLRILGCELIQTSGILLQLPQVALATGQILFQRFYYSKSIVKYKMELIAMGCVYLAAKIEETPRRIRDIIRVFHHLKQLKDKCSPIKPMILDSNYINLKIGVIKAEKQVLQRLGFCVHVKHPHKIIVMFLKVLECEALEEQQQLIQKSWNYMNDSLRTNVFVRYSPESIACACIQLSAHQLKIPLPKEPRWYYLFGATDEEVRDISITILKLYQRSKPDYDSLEKIVEELKKTQMEAIMKSKNILGNHLSDRKTFSPGITPSHEISPTKKEKENSKHCHSPRDTNHVKKQSRSPPHSDKSQEESSKSRSRSPRQKSRRYKDASKSRSRSRSRSRSSVIDRRDSKHHHSSHKRQRSYSRSYSQSPLARSIQSSVVKKSYHYHRHKDSKSRRKSRSRSKDLEEIDRNQRYYSRSRSRSYDKYKDSRWGKRNNRDGEHHRHRHHHRSKSRDRTSRRDYS